MDYMDYIDYIYMDYMDYLWIMMMIFLNVVDCYDVLLVYPIIFQFIFSTTLHGEAEVPMKQKQHIYLVGGFNPSEKYSSVGIIIPNIWKNQTCSKPATRHILAGECTFSHSKRLMYILVGI